MNTRTLVALLLLALALTACGVSGGGGCARTDVYDETQWQMRFEKLKPTPASAVGFRAACDTLWVDEHGTLHGTLSIENSSDDEIVLSKNFTSALGWMRPVPPIDGLRQRAIDTDPPLDGDRALLVVAPRSTVQTQWKAWGPLSATWLAQARRGPIPVRVEDEVLARINQGQYISIRYTIDTTLRFGTP